MDLIDEIRLVEKRAELLVSEDEIQRALERMAKKISQRLADKCPVVLCVTNGGIIITGLLLPKLRFPLELDSINVSRYHGGIRGGTPRWLIKPQTALRNRNVLIVDDILDEGLTLAEICRYCKDQGAATILTAVLVDKRFEIEKPVSADIVGVECENSYLFGYGLDYKGYLRNAPGIYACRED